MSNANKAASQSYIARLYYNKPDTEIIRVALEHDQNVLLLGPKGTGKNSLAETVAEEMGLDFVYIPCHRGATSETMLGQWIPNPAGSGYIWMDGLLTDAVRRGKICMLDEVNALRPEVAFVVHALLDNRREVVLTEKPDAVGSPERVPAHENFGLIGAGNLNYEGTRPMNEAFRDRFAIQLSMGAVKELDQMVLEEHPVAAQMEPFEVEAVKLFTEKVHEGRKAGALYTEVSTRAFVDLMVNMHLHGFKVARTVFLARFDDSAEQTALRTTFRDVYNNEGVPLQGSPSKSKSKKKKGGRAGKFGDQGGSAATQGQAGDI